MGRNIEVYCLLNKKWIRATIIKVDDENNYIYAQYLDGSNQHQWFSKFSSRLAPIGFHYQFVPKMNKRNNVPNITAVVDPDLNKRLIKPLSGKSTNLIILYVNYLYHNIIVYYYCQILSICFCRFSIFFLVRARVTLSAQHHQQPPPTQLQPQPQPQPQQPPHYAHNSSQSPMRFGDPDQVSTNMRNTANSAVLSPNAMNSAPVPGHHQMHQRVLSHVRPNPTAPIYPPPRPKRSRMSVTRTNNRIPKQGWYYQLRDDKFGPIAIGQLFLLCVERKINESSPVYHQQYNWTKLIDLPHIVQLFRTHIIKCKQYSWVKCT